MEQFKAASSSSKNDSSDKKIPFQHLLYQIYPNCYSYKEDTNAYKNSSDNLYSSVYSSSHSLNDKYLSNPSTAKIPEAKGNIMPAEEFLQTSRSSNPITPKRSFVDYHPELDLSFNTKDQLNFSLVKTSETNGSIIPDSAAFLQNPSASFQIDSKGLFPSNPLYTNWSFNIKPQSNFSLANSPEPLGNIIPAPATLQQKSITSYLFFPKMPFASSHQEADWSLTTKDPSTKISKFTRDEIPMIALAERAFSTYPISAKLPFASFNPEVDKTSNISDLSSSPLTEFFKSTKKIIPKAPQLPQTTINSTLISPKSHAASPPKIDWSCKFPWEEAIQKINREVFRNQQFKKNQREIINAVLSGKDTFAFMPTGSGKSLTYQIPGYYLEGITIVITPLIALIQDQAERLRSLNIACEYFSDEIYNTDHFCRSIIANKKIKFVFITPERLLKNSKFQNFLKLLEKMKRLERFVIDEAHCITFYSKEFRPEYKSLSYLKENYPCISVLCLTASVTKKQVHEIMKNLKISDYEFFADGVYRPNLFYEIIEKAQNPIEQLVSLLANRFKDQTGIIYYNNKLKCEKLSETLNSYQLSSSYFHSQLDMKTKDTVRKEWQQGIIKIIVATCSFGMGIDNKNVRFIIHFKIPKSLVEFYQESGRAGRDGQKSDCIVLYNFEDRYPLYHFLKFNEAEDQIQGMKEIYKILKFCEDRTTCRKKLISKYFHMKETFNCDNMCDNCIRMANPDLSVELVNFTQEAKNIQKFVNRNGIRRDLTIDDISNILRGIDQKYSKFADFGSLSYLSESEVTEIFLKMLRLKIISERITKYGSFSRPYVGLGPKQNKEFQISIKRNIFLPTMNEYTALNWPENSKKQVESRSKPQEVRMIHDPNLPKKRPRNNFNYS